METNSDRFRAVAFSLGVHAVVILVLWRGLLMQPELQAAGAEGPAIEATLVSAPQSSAPVSPRQIHATAPPQPPPQAQPQPAPLPQDSPQPQQLKSQTALPKPDTVDQDEVRHLAEQAVLQKQMQEQEERHRQAQIDLSQRQEQQEAESRQRQTQQDLEKQLADIRKQRADAEHQVKLQEEKLKQIEDRKTTLTQDAAPAATPQSSQADAASFNPGLIDRYRNAIKEVVNHNWRRSGIPEKVHCAVNYTQDKRGNVIQVEFGVCPFDAAERLSIREALMRTPLPYTGFESVFKEDGTIDMCYPEEACK